jgi:hypothetical protein
MESWQKRGIQFVVHRKIGIKAYTGQAAAEVFAQTEKGTRVQTLASYLTDLKAR